MTSFRRWTAWMLLWLSASFALLLAHELLLRRTLSGRLAAIRAELDELLATIREEKGWWDSAAEPVAPVDTSDLADLGYEEFLAAYIARLEEQRDLEKDAAVSHLLAARLALLGVIPWPPGRYLHIDLAQELLGDEVPEIWRPRIEKRVLAALEDLPEHVAEEGKLTTRHLLHFGQNEGFFESASRCVAITRGSGDYLAANMLRPAASRRIAGGRLLQFDPQGPEVAALADTLGDGAFKGTFCLASEAEVSDGRVLYGYGIGDTWRLARETRWALVAFSMALGVLLTWMHLRALRRERRVLTELESVGETLGKEPPDIGGQGAIAATLRRVLARAEQRIALAHRATDDIAHNLRTELTRLRGQLDLLGRMENPSHEAGMAVQAAADRLLTAFNALLRISRLESGQSRHAFLRFDVGALARDVIELYEPAFQDADISLLGELGEGAWDTHGDPDLWMQALSNLMDNALRYTPAAGQVTLQLDRPWKGKLRIRIRDSGPGVPERDLERLQERFFRLPQHSEIEGSGLGLSLVAAICRLHGAELELANREGLEVSITMPAA